LKDRRLAILCGIVLLSSLLLLYQLDAKSLWVDELFSVKISTSSDVASVVNGVILEERRPPLYHLALHFWIAAFGTSDFPLRLLSVVFGVLSVIVAFKIGRLQRSDDSGLLTAYLLAISPTFVLYSRMIRYYSLVMFLGLLSCLFFVQLVRQRKAASWLGYLLSSALLIYTDYSALSLLIGQNVLVLLQWKSYRDVLRRWALSQALLLILFLPWVTVVVTHGTRGELEADFARGALGYFLKLAYPFFSFAVGETLFPWRPLAAIALAAVLTLFVGGIVFLARDHSIAVPVVFLFIPLTFTIFLLSYIAPDITFLNVASRTLFAAPFFYLIVASGLLWIRSRRWRAIVVTAITVAWSCSLLNYYTNQQFHNPIYVIPAREMAAQVATASQPGDVVVSDWDSAFGYYYAKLDRSTPHFFSPSSQSVVDHHGARQDQVLGPCRTHSTAGRRL
jgi:mannosyltransferase